MAMNLQLRQLEDSVIEATQIYYRLLRLIYRLNTIKGLTALDKALVIRAFKQGYQL